MKIVLLLNDKILTYNIYLLKITILSILFYFEHS